MIAEPWGRPSLNALFGTEFISLCVSHKCHGALEEWQVGPVQREQMGPGHRESCLAIGMKQGVRTEPGAPTAYGWLGKMSVQEGGGLSVKGRQENQEVGVVLVRPELLQNAKCWGKANNEARWGLAVHNTE